MKISCACGAHIVDSSDGLPHKGHVIADADLFPLLDAIDAAIEQTGPSADAREAAAMRVRALLGRLTRTMWQCARCGRLHVDDLAHRIHTFAPETAETSREVLRR